MSSLAQLPLGLGAPVSGREERVFEQTVATGGWEFVPVRKFARHCIDEFEWLAVNDPLQLVRLTRDSEIRADPVWLSQIYESMALGSSWGFERELLEGLRHEKPFVREAALAGITRFLSHSREARAALRDIAAMDKSEAVRFVAKDLLSNL